MSRKKARTALKPWQVQIVNREANRLEIFMRRWRWRLLARVRDQLMQRVPKK